VLVSVAPDRAALRRFEHAQEHQGDADNGRNDEGEGEPDEQVKQSDEQSFAETSWKHGAHDEEVGRQRDEESEGRNRPKTAASRRPATAEGPANEEAKNGVNDHRGADDTQGAAVAELRYTARPVRGLGIRLAGVVHLQAAPRLLDARELVVQNACRLQNDRPIKNPIIDIPNTTKAFIARDMAQSSARAPRRIISLGEGRRPSRCH
jgi:hypothetical protein